mmetsp:Transcript_23402/g.54446  ORF Transcript_23402/g.54446 Transcript_23402/m.54446 type:complete len:582 (-) Transcript_23402:77-1822(-)
MAAEEVSGVPQQFCDPSLFATPKSLSVSGGTAAFFEVKYAGPPSGPQAQRYGKTPNYWIGKDLARARDEIDFYEGISRLPPSFRLIHKWAMDYGGVLVKQCLVGGALEPDPRQLLLLENLRDGKQSLRMLDIKLGNVTAVQGWKGKSFTGTLTNRFVDYVSTSNQRGNRLEGFDNPPQTLQTRMDGPPQACFGIDRSKKYKRLCLQRLSTVEALANFAEMADMQTTAGANSLSSIEYSEALLYDLALQLSELCYDSRNMPVPQMWIGSSLGVCCDGGSAPSRSKVEPLKQGKSGKLALVRIFDWGRSELGTHSSYAALSHEDQEERILRWRQWHQALVRILVSCLTAYYRQFLWNAKEPRPFRGEIRFELWDADTLEENDYIGCVSLPLAPTRGRVQVDISGENLVGLDACSLLARAAAEGPFMCSDEVSTLEIEVEEGHVPRGSRLEKIWYITVHGVYGVPHRDLFSASDPVVHVQITSDSLMRGPMVSTPTIWDVQDAEFGTRLEFGVVRQDLEHHIFNDMSRIWAGTISPDMFRKVTQAMLDLEDPATALDRLEEADEEYEHDAVLDEFLHLTDWIAQ